MIVGQPSKRPYGAQLRVHAQTGEVLGRLEESCVLLSTGTLLTATPRRKAPWEGGETFNLRLEGFATAAAAEAGGRRLVQSLLWMAVSLDSPLRLDYQSYEPCAVFERGRSDGARMEAFVTRSLSAEFVIEEVHAAYAKFADPNSNVMLSMEIFAGARLEASERARFLAVVSAFEPLGQDEQSLGPEVDQFVAGCLERLREESAISEPGRASLEGRLQSLRRESVRQALRRVVRQALPQRKDTLILFDEAYSLRSQIVHAGRPDNLDVDLEHEGRRVAQLLRQIYASLLGGKLRVEANTG